MSRVSHAGRCLACSNKRTQIARHDAVELAGHSEVVPWWPVMSCKCQADDTGGETSGFPQSWSLLNATPLQRRGMGIPPPGHTPKGSVLQKRAMQDHGAIIGPQYALAWVREAQSIGERAQSGCSATQQQQSGRRRVQGGIACRQRYRLARWPGTAAQPVVRRHSWDGVVRCEMKVAFFHLLPATACHGRASPAMVAAAGLLSSTRSPSSHPVRARLERVCT